MDAIKPLFSIPPMARLSAQAEGRQSGQPPSPGQLLKALILEKQGGDQFLLDIGGSKITARSKTALPVGESLQLQLIKTSPQVELKIVSDSLPQFLGKNISLVGKNIDLTSLYQAISKESGLRLANLSPTARQSLEGFFLLQQGNTQDRVSQIASQGQPLSSPIALPRLELAIASLQQHLIASHGGRLGGSLANQLQTFIEGENGTAFTRQLAELGNLPEKGRADALVSLLLHSIPPGQRVSLSQPLLSFFTSAAGKIVLQQFLDTTLPVPQQFPASQLQQSLAGKEGGALLKQLVENLGLQLERNLSMGATEKAQTSLKAALLELTASLGSSEKLSQSARNLVSTIEIFQLAQLHTNGENHLIFPIPLPFIENGYLSYFREGEKGDGPGPSDQQSFSLHLKMQELGNIQVDFLLTKESLLIRFRAEDQDRLAFIEEFTKELEESISIRDHLSIVFASDAPDPIQDLLEAMLPQDGKILDTSI